MLILKRTYFIIITLLLFTGCWNNNNDDNNNNKIDLCKNISCTDHGKCIELENMVKCECDNGYIEEDLNCILKTEPDPCDPNPCNEDNKNVCTNNNGTAVCFCNSGYYEDDNNNCIEDLPPDPCDPNPCDEENKAVCVSVDDSVICSCNIDYHEDDCGNCVPDFESVTCNPNPCIEERKNICTLQDELVFCSCNPGFSINENNNCVQDKPTELTTISSDLRVNCGIDNNSKLWCWGTNLYRNLNDDSEDIRNIPVIIEPEETWLSVSANSSICAIKSDKTLWCWGKNSYGQLGDGTNENKYLPVSIGTVNNSKWKSVSTGLSHTCGILDDNSLWCWGDNILGQLGDGTEENINIPIEIGTEYSWKSVSSGSLNTCAIQSDKSLWCWGANGHGQIGDGTHEKKNIPVKIGNEYDWNFVSINHLYSCAIKDDKSLWCWGNNEYGQLGNGTEESQKRPVNIEPESRWLKIETGDDFTCAIKDDNSIWCWGVNGGDQLGIMPYKYKVNIPTQVGSDYNWIDVSTGSSHVDTGHTCALKDDYSLWCWGSNDKGQLGNGLILEKNIPIRVKSSDNNWKKLKIGGRPACAIKNDDSLWCWGDNDFGQLGNGEFRNNSSVPIQIKPENKWLEITPGIFHTCGIMDDNTLWCWGRSDFGALAIPTVHQEDGSVAQPIPVQIGIDNDWISVSVGYGHTCGLKNDNSLWCWGRNESGELGDGTVNSKRISPEKVGSNEWIKVFAIRTSTCGIKEDNTLWCWGDNSFEQFGYKSENWEVPTPTQVLPESKWLDIFGDNSYLCGLKNDKTLWCMGFGAYQIADITYTSDIITSETNFYPPFQVCSDKKWIKISGGDYHICNINEDNSLWCWGNNNEDGQLGIGSYETKNKPTKIGLNSDWLDISSGKTSTCGIKNDNSLWCWGNDAWGGVGDGTTNQEVPIQIIP